VLKKQKFVSPILNTHRVVYRLVDGERKLNHLARKTGGF